MRSIGSVGVAAAMLIGAFVLLTLASQHMKAMARRELPLWAFVPVGFVTGVLNMIVGVIGPILGVLVIRKDLSKEAVVATLSFFGFIGKPEPVIHQLYCEPLQKFRLAAQGHGPIQPPDRLRARVEKFFDPLPIWYPPFEHLDAEGYPVSALTQRPMAMYHSWGSQNAWLRQITGENRLYMHPERARQIGVDRRGQRFGGGHAWVNPRRAASKAQGSTG